MDIESYLATLKDVGITDLVDIALMSVLIYAVLVWFQRRRAILVLSGIVICGLLYVVAHLFNLFLTTSVLQAFFAVILIAIIIIFQEELRSFFEQIAVWSLNRKFRGRIKLHYPPRIDILVRTLTDLSESKIGALIVIKGKDTVDRYLEGGVDLGGQISEALLKSIFDPHSIGHDGAVYMNEDRVVQFGCHLPLSKNFRKLQHAGTRHAAAMGLSEKCDALCLVASEETGSISVARDGVMMEMVDGNLRQALEKFYEATSPFVRKGFWRGLFTSNLKEKVSAILITCCLWFVVVHESAIIHKTFQIPVEYAEPGAGLYVESVTPKQVEVTFSGPRHAFNFISNNVRLFLRLYNYGQGEWVVSTADSHFTYPKEIALEDVQPRIITVEIEKK